MFGNELHFHRSTAEQKTSGAKNTPIVPGECVICLEDISEEVLKHYCDHGFIVHAISNGYLLICMPEASRVVDLPLLQMYGRLFV